MSLLDRQRAAAEGNMLAAKIRSLEATIGALRKEVKDAKQQRDALVAALYSIVGDDIENACDIVHHKKSDRHTVGEPCPVLARYRAALKRVGES